MEKVDLFPNITNNVEIKSAEISDKLRRENINID